MANNEKFISAKEITMPPISRFQESAIKRVSQSPATEESGGVTEILIQTAFVISLIVANSIAGSMCNAWIMLNMMQLWWITALIDLFFPSATQFALMILHVINFENPFTSEVTFFMFPEDYF